MIDLPEIHTARLRLVTLDRDLARARLDGLTRHGDIHFTHDWPGDSLPRFLALVSSPADALPDAMVIVHDDEAIGMVSTAGSPTHGVAEIGYGLVPHARGRGFATEAVAALTRALHERGLVVTALTERGNTPSERVLERCGFIRGGEHPQRGGAPVTDWTCGPPRPAVPS